MTQIRSNIGLSGRVEVAVRRDGEIVHHQVVSNLVTSAGDQAYAERAAGVSTPDAAVTGMQLGTGGGTVAAKSGAGAAIVSYISGSAEPLDGEPDVSGGVITYVCTWEAGDLNSTGITEAVLVNASGPPDSAQAAAATIARVVLSAFNVLTDDSLEITWTNTILGE